MKWHSLTTYPSKRAKRVGRGIGSGHGKTSGRGTKGQSSRSGGCVRPGFEGGQNPLHMRLPKQRGFKSRRVPTQTVGTARLNQLKAGAKVTLESLLEAGLIDNSKAPVRLLYTGKLDKKLTVELQGASAQAQAAVTKAGGKFTKTPLRATSKASPKQG